MTSLVRDGLLGKKSILVTVLLLVDLVTLIFGFWLFYTTTAYRDSTPLSIFLMIPVWLLLFWLFELYRVNNLFTGQDEYASVFNACVVGTILFGLFGFFNLGQISISVNQLLFLWVLIVFSVGTGRFVLRRLVWRMRANQKFLKKALIIGVNQEAETIAREIQADYKAGISLIGFVDDKSVSDRQMLFNVPIFTSSSETVPVLVKRYGIEEIIIASTALSREKFLNLFQSFQTFTGDTNIRLSPGLYGLLPINLKSQKFGDITLLNINKIRLTKRDIILKRLLDVLISVIGLIIFFPVMFVIAIAIKLDSPGPVLYPRRVVGRGNHLIDAWKFRTMFIDAEERLNKDPVLRRQVEEQGRLLAKDPRITRVGRFLRRISIDELPQFFNVLLGQMSLVGPRMITLEEQTRYGKWAVYLSAKPGVTGLGQISGRSDVTYRERVLFDLSYILNYSIWRDLYIMWRTMPAILEYGRDLERPNSQIAISRDQKLAMDGLAAELAQALGLSIVSIRKFEKVYSYLVEAPILRLNIPRQFPVFFVAESQPDDGTIKMLVDVFDTLRNPRYFAIVLLLEALTPQSNPIIKLRHALQRSPQVHDFIILSQSEIQDILVADYPTEIITKHILAQIDLTVVSPFVINGPVPETMFFGREAEIKTLVEGAYNQDFAIVGNRKIGKTSLLKRALTRLETGRQLHPLWVDCQTAHEAADFYQAFQSQTGLTLPAASPEGLRQVLNNFSQQQGRPVLLLDEIDGLLIAEQQQGERLAAMWRALAQAGICHFIFCGSTGLARSLDNSHSVFFNFPQPLSLGYLTPSVAQLVLLQPLEILGLIPDAPEALTVEALSLTSGHPNLIQYLGRSLIEAANHRNERRILVEDVQALRTTPAFIEYYFKTVWGEAGPLEKLITLVAPGLTFNLNELEQALVKWAIPTSPEQLEAALKLLRVYAILEKDRYGYSFIPQAFPELINQSQDVTRLVELEKRRWLVEVS